MFNTFWNIFSSRRPIILWKIYSVKAKQLWSMFSVDVPSVAPCFPIATFASDLNFVGLQCSESIPPFEDPVGPYRCECLEKIASSEMHGVLKMCHSASSPNLSRIYQGPGLLHRGSPPCPAH